MQIVFPKLPSNIIKAKKVAIDLVNSIGGFDGKEELIKRIEDIVKNDNWLVWGILHDLFKEEVKADFLIFNNKLYVRGDNFKSEESKNNNFFLQSHAEPTTIICSCGCSIFKLVYGNYNISGICSNCQTKESVYSG